MFARFLFSTNSFSGAPRYLSVHLEHAPFNGQDRAARWLALGAVLLTAALTRPVAAQISVTPDGGSRTVSANSPDMVVFTVTNDGDGETVYLSCDPSGKVLTCSPPPSVWVGTGQSVNVDVDLTVGTDGDGQVTLTASGTPMAGSDEGYYDVTVVSAPSNWDISLYNNDNQRCADSCTGAVMSHTTVPYFSLDTPRNVTVVYNSERVNPKPLVHVDVTNLSGTPDGIWLEVKRNGAFMTFVNGEQTLKFNSNGSGVTKLAGRLDATGLSTGMYDIEIIVHWKYGGSTTTQTWNTRLMVVDETDSYVARGWNFAGVQRLHVQSGGHALITGGDGSAAFFEYTGSAFVAPKGDFSELETWGSGYRRRYADSSEVYFNSTGRMTDFYDPDNNRTRFYHNGSGQLYAVRDPRNRSTYLQYDANGLSTVYAAVGTYRYTNYTVLSNRTLTEIEDPDFRTTTFGYNGAYQLTSMTDRNGNTSTFDYFTVTGELESITSPPVAVYGAGTQALVTAFTPWTTRMVPSTPTASSPFWGQPGGVNPVGWVTDAAGDKTYASPNRWGDAQSVFAPITTYATWTRYTEDGLPARMVRWGVGIDSVDGGWGLDSVAYNSNGMPVWSKELIAGDSARQIRYSASFPTQADSMWGGGGAAVRRGINGATGRVDWERVGGMSGMTSYSYGSYGLLLSVTNPENHVVASYNYDNSLTNLKTVTLPGSRTVEYGRDSYGRPTTVTPPDGPARTTYYDIMNRPDSVWDGVNTKKTRFTYGTNFTEVTDPKDQIYRTEFNALGWVTREVDPTGAADVYEYDAKGQLRAWTNRRGQVTTYTYDAVGRLLSTSSGGNAYSFDAATLGRIVTAQNAYSTETTYLNNRGQPDSVHTYFPAIGKTYTLQVYYSDSSDGVVDSIIPSAPGVTFMKRGYSFDVASGALKQISLDGKSTSLDFFTDGALQSITFSGGDAVNKDLTHTNSEYGSTTTGAYGNDVDRQTGYDPNERIELLTMYTNTEAIRFGYDDMGRLTGDTIGTLSVSGCFGDPDDRGFYCPPSSWTAIGAQAFQYQYDEVGNRNDLGGQYTTGNRVSSVDGCTYTHDTDGNISTRNCGGTVTTFTWRDDNRLASVQVTAPTVGAPKEFRYDARGRLVQIHYPWMSSNDRFFWWQGDNLLAELYAAGTVVAEYSYYPGLDNLHAIKKFSDIYYAHSDPLGNVVALTHADTKTIERTYRYRAWGVNWTGADLDGFNGRDRARWKGALWFGEVGMYYMRNRWYDPALGRFVSEDPIGLQGGMNLYAFATADPVNGRDPLGLDPDCILRWIESTGKWEKEGSCGGGEILGLIQSLFDFLVGAGLDPSNGNWHGLWGSGQSSPSLGQGRCGGGANLGCMASAIVRGDDALKAVDFFLDDIHKGCGQVTITRRSRELRTGDVGFWTVARVGPPKEAPWREPIFGLKFKMLTGFYSGKYYSEGDQNLYNAFGRVICRVGAVFLTAWNTPQR